MAGQVVIKHLKHISHLKLFVLKICMIDSATERMAKILGNDTSPSDSVWNLGVVFDIDLCVNLYISCKIMFLSHS